MADRSLALLGEQTKRRPESMPQMLVALDFHLHKPKQIVIAGNLQGEDTRKMLREVHRQFIPGKSSCLPMAEPDSSFWAVSPVP